MGISSEVRVSQLTFAQLQLFVVVLVEQRVFGVTPGPALPRRVDGLHAQISLGGGRSHYVRATAPLWELCLLLGRDSASGCLLLGA